MNNKEIVKEIVEEVIKHLDIINNCIDVEASAKHVHLSQRDLDILFDEGYTLTFVRDLSQPNQFLSKERVDLKGPKGTIKNVAILGPTRLNTQVEVSYTDARILGINPPVKESGDLSNSETITIINGDKRIVKSNSTIVAKRHIHITPEDANRMNVVNGEVVKTEIFTDRKLIFDDVVVRVSDKFKTKMHIDYDEANACGFVVNKTKAVILK